MATSTILATKTHEEVNAIGMALGDARWERGLRLTEAERRLMTHVSMFGSAGYPLRKLGRKWTLDHDAIPHAPLYATKRAAVEAFEIYEAIWRRLSGLASHERAMTERG